MESKIFGSSPFWNEDPEILKSNISYAKKLARLIFDYGYIPILPHLFYPRFLKETQENRDKVFEWTRQEYFEDKATRVSGIWILKGGLSNGMSLEHQWAEEYNIPISFIDRDLLI